MLRELGFDVREEPFSYSAFPGRLGTPLVGGVLGATIVASAVLSLDGHATAACVTLLVLSGAAALFARWMLRDGVLNAPWMRAQSHNLVATRGGGEPRVWLVAHLDSKSQPVPSAVRMGGATLLAIALVLAVISATMAVVGHPSSALAWATIVVGAVGALPVMASVVGERSDGAVDNASGVAAVLAAAALVPPTMMLGVLIPSAEELGLAGARAWVRGRARAVAVNCDGVDDDGLTQIMYDTPAPARLIEVARVATRAAGLGRSRARRMPPGLLTDSTAFASAGWESVTVSHGALATLRRVHSARDSLENLRGTSIDTIADVLARIAGTLAADSR